MDLIADILLIAGALGAAFYCVVLSRRLARFNDLETGVGGAIAVLSAQVDDMTLALRAARGTAEGSADALEALTDRADNVAKRLELLVAAMHDLPETAPPVEPSAPPRADRGESPVPETVPPPAVARSEVRPESPLPKGPAELDAAPAPALFRSHRGWPREAAE